MRGFMPAQDTIYEEENGNFPKNNIQQLTASSQAYRDFGYRSSQAAMPKGTGNTLTGTALLPQPAQPKGEEMI